MGEYNRNIYSVQPLPNYTLLLEFENSEYRTINIKKHIGEFIGVFAELLDENNFKKVHVREDDHTVEWFNGVDLDPASLYMNSEPYRMTV